MVMQIKLLLFPWSHIHGNISRFYFQFFTSNRNDPLTPPVQKSEKIMNQLIKLLLQIFGVRQRHKPCRCFWRLHTKQIELITNLFPLSEMSSIKALSFPPLLFFSLSLLDAEPLFFRAAASTDRASFFRDFLLLETGGLRNSASSAQNRKATNVCFFTSNVVFENLQMTEILQSI